MYKKIQVLVLIFLLLSTSFETCYASYRQIVDTEGRTVTIPQKIQRAVVLSATCIETIYIIGALNKVVGISRNMLENPVYAELIPGLRNIPVVAQSIRTINIERVLSLNPDLIITMGPEHPLGMDRKTIKRLEELGVPVILINLDSLDENYYSIKLMGYVFGNTDRAEELIQYMKHIIKDIQQKVKPFTTRKVKALYVSGDKPNYIAGGYWGKQDIIVLAGGCNVANKIKHFMTTVSFEQINIWNPDVITISSQAKYSVGDVLKSPHLQRVSAIRKKRVYKHPYHVAGLFTPRIPLLLAWHAAHFYPELKIDWIRITDAFLKKFYGVAYHEKQQ